MKFENCEIYFPAELRTLDRIMWCLERFPVKDCVVTILGQRAMVRVLARPEPDGESQSFAE